MNNKKLRYTTLKGIISKTEQFSFDNMLSKRFYHKIKGHNNFILSEQVETEILNLFSDFLGIYINKDNIKNLKSCGIYERLIINKRTLKVEYIAGQEYITELRYIKKLIKKEL